MFKKELSKEDITKLKETIRTKLREKKIEEDNTTASADGYNTPFAFGKDTKGDIKRKVKSSGEGFEFAKSIDENRWLDLKRWGVLLERVKKHNPQAAPNIKDFHVLRPIPQIQIDRAEGTASSFPQNPGY
jgi:hypothetical protein